MPTITEVLGTYAKSGGISNLINEIEKEIVRAKISGDITQFIKRLSNITSVISPNDLEELKNIKPESGEDLVQRLPELMSKYNKAVLQLQEKGEEINKTLLQYIPQFLLYGDEGLRALDILSYVARNKIETLKSNVDLYERTIKQAGDILDLRNRLATVRINELQLQNLTARRQIPELYNFVTSMPEYKMLQDLIVTPHIVTPSGGWQKVIEQRRLLLNTIEDKIKNTQSYPSEAIAEVMDNLNKMASSLDFKIMQPVASTDANKTTSEALNWYGKFKSANDKILAVMGKHKDILDVYQSYSDGARPGTVSLPALGMVIKELDERISLLNKGITTKTGPGGKPIKIAEAGADILDKIKSYEKLKEELTKLELDLIEANAYLATYISGYETSNKSNKQSENKQGGR